MADSPLVSEIWEMVVYYDKFTANNKQRPVLIINHDESTDIFTIQEITSEPPKNNNFHEKCKSPILDWKSRDVGLIERSFVKCASNNTHLIERMRLLVRVGEMTERDFLSAFKTILLVKNIRPRARVRQ